MRRLPGLPPSLPMRPDAERAIYAVDRRMAGLNRHPTHAAVVASARQLTRLLAMASAAWFVALAAGCAEKRDPSPPPPVYTADVGPLLQARCGECHGNDAGEGGMGGDAPAAGYRVDDYLGAIGCSEGTPERPVIEPAAPRAPLLWTLRFDPDHVDLLGRGELADVQAWVVAGAPLRAGGVHGGDILRPNARGFHGTLAGQEHFAPLTDDDHTWACGQCHAGAPAGGTPAAPPPGASACTSCHTAPEGVLACDTCHGDEGRPYPPRDPCFHVEEGAAGGAHASHLNPGVPMAVTLDCNSCHPAADASLTGSHADGQVDVNLALPGNLPEVAADYDGERSRCAVYCHNRGGDAAMPAWFEARPVDCNSCHESPPPDHYAGACSDCHQEANAAGDALIVADDGSPPAHLNGRVDVGDGSSCGGCHGDGQPPWPDTPSHRAHRDTQLTAPITCDSCHRVPDEIEAAGHLDRGESSPADVMLAPGLARDDDAMPRYADGTCTDIRCHQSGDTRRFRWDEPEAALGCTGCHGAPPALPHPQDDGCAQLRCHGGEVGFGEGGRLRISPAGRAQHMDGEVTGGPD